MQKDERAFSLALDAQLVSARAAEQSKTQDYVKLQERYDQLMKSLKATRDQRVKDAESGKETFLGLIKMLQQRDIQEKEGRQMGLMQLAAAKEYNNLGQLHKYEDGNIDRPILSADTVDLEEDEIQ